MDKIMDVMAKITVIIVIGLFILFGSAIAGGLILLIKLIIGYII